MSWFLHVLNWKSCCHLQMTCLFIILLCKQCLQDERQHGHFSLFIFPSVSIPLAMCLTWVVPHTFISLVIPGSNFSCRGNPPAPSTYSPSVVPLSCLLSVAEPVNDCVLFILFLQWGSFRWGRTRLAFFFLQSVHECLQTATVSWVQ